MAPTATARPDRRGTPTAAQLQFVDGRKQTPLFRLVPISSALLRPLLVETATQSHQLTKKKKEKRTNKRKTLVRRVPLVCASVCVSVVCVLPHVPTRAGRGSVCFVGFFFIVCVGLFLFSQSLRFVSLLWRQRRTDTGCGNFGPVNTVDFGHLRAAPPSPLQGPRTAGG